MIVLWAITDFGPQMWGTESEGQAVGGVACEGAVDADGAVHPEVEAEVARRGSGLSSWTADRDTKNGLGTLEPWGRRQANTHNPRSGRPGYRDPKIIQNLKSAFGST